MMSQGDSIDIVRLKRVALGLEDDSLEQLTVYATDVVASGKQLANAEKERNSTSVGDSQSAERRPDRNPTEAITTTALLPGFARSAEHHVLSINESVQDDFVLSTRSSPLYALRVRNMSSTDIDCGDTQVVSQSVYDSILQHNEVEVQNIVARPFDDFGNGAEGATLVTLHEGDTGHIDLLSGFPETHPDGNIADDVDHDEEDNSSRPGESSPLQYQLNLFPESQRFLTTPATSVSKQISAQSLSTVTPLTSHNPFAANIESSGGLLGLSQLFRATQAPSSPLANTLQSEPMSDRPSPNIPIQSRTIALGLSSPYVDEDPRGNGDVSDPLMKYISMKESQAAREKVKVERLARSANDIHSEDQNDDDFGKESSYAERLRRERRIEEETRAQLAAISAPARRPPNLRAKSMLVTGASSPKRLRRNSYNERSAGVSFDEVPRLPHAMEPGGTSEEETEPEELDLQVPSSQLLQSSAEEDKENFNDPAIGSSAHDRLSQVLELEMHVSPSTPRQAINSDLMPPRPPVSPITPIYEDIVVKDSQGVAESEDSEDDEQSDVRTPRLNDPAYGCSQDRITSSPLFRRPLASSPPVSVHDENVPMSQPRRSSRDRQMLSTLTRSTSFAPAHSPSQLRRANLKSQELGTTATSNTSGRSGGQMGRPTYLDGPDKPSSMPSLVAETPVHEDRRPAEDLVPMTSIPETSPNRLLGTDGDDETHDYMAGHDDDDVLPLPSAGHERFCDAQQNGLLRLSRARPHCPKILSSPSGRQRRALTEIAADVSPQVGAGLFDVDYGLFSVDDKHFRSLTGISPLPPRKRRRGNDGRDAYASDPVHPVTPRSTSPRTIRHRPEKTGRFSEQQAAEPIAEAEAVAQIRPRTPRRVEAVWEIEDSPSEKVARTTRISKLSISRLREQKVSSLKRNRDADLPEAVVIKRSKSMAGETRHSKELRQVVDDESISVIGPSSTADLPKIATNQVLALWRGQQRAYHPATCFGTPIGTSKSHYVVQFVDSAPVEVPVGAVKRLELRIGDAVKVNMPNVPKVTHIIRGFGGKLTEEDFCRESVNNFATMTDIFGHSTLILGPKQRKTLPNGGLSGLDRTIEVPMSNIYLDTILWNQLKDRDFTFTSTVAQTDSGFRTPSERHATPVSPSSRLSRNVNLRSSLFSGMVFAVSYIEEGAVKSRVTRLIEENDGRILTGGFNELFEMPSILPIASPLNSPASATDTETFRLSRLAEDVGFTCLVADKHSRREKYMQALALNLPCLSGRWIEDCVAQNRILDWDMYLLPAGESMYLNGATKSRTLTPHYSAESARLSETLTGRPKLLDGQSVLLVMGRGKAEEKRKAYIFLTYALGASKVERVHDLSAAKTVIDLKSEDADCPGWDWVYVDDHEQAKARDMLLGTTERGSRKAQSSAAGKGHKMNERTASKIAEHESGLGQGAKVRIVSSEFVCQSLILGRLFEG